MSEEKQIENNEEEIEINLKDELKKIFSFKLTTILFVLPLFIAMCYYAIFETNSTFQTISLIVFAIFISFASIQDFAEKMVLEIFLMIAGISSIFYVKTDIANFNLEIFGKEIGMNLAVGLGLILFIWLLSKTVGFILKKQAMGEGDYPIFFAMIIFCGFLTSYCLIIMSLTAIVYKLITKEETIPLIPFMQLGIISTLFLEKYYLSSF